MTHTYLAHSLTLTNMRRRIHVIWYMSYEEEDTLRIASALQKASTACPKRTSMVLPAPATSYEEEDTCHIIHVIWGGGYMLYGTCHMRRRIHACKCFFTYHCALAQCLLGDGVSAVRWPGTTAADPAQCSEIEACDSITGLV
jgi:hypothetical protein